jgi:thymidylate kinase
MLIALTGNDGSGKTSLGERLEAELRKSHSRVRRLEEFNYFFLNLSRKVLGQNKTAETQASIEATDPHPTLATRLLPFIMLVDTSLQTWYFKLCKRSELIIKDRCVYDYLATWRELGVANSLVEFLYRHAPKPDVTFYITVAPETSLARRTVQKDKNGAKSLEFYQKKRALYDVITPNFRIMPIDNNGDMAVTLKELVLLSNFRTNITRYKRIAISGLDGAGKSTTIEGLATLLDALNVRFRSIHFYYNYSILKLMKRFRKAKKPSAIDEQKQYEKSVAHEKKSVAGGKSKLWIALILGDSLLQYYLIRLISWRRVVIFDRFFPDYFVSFDFLKVAYNRRTLARSLPRPDLYFLQTADYRVLHERKPEHTLKFFKECHAAYEKLAREQHMITLDSSKNSPDDLLLELTNVIAKGQK